MDPIPVACSLQGADARDRLAVIARLREDALLDRYEILDGLRARFRDAPGVEDRIHALIAAEARCCPFLSFDLRREAGVLCLDVSGAPEARPVIESFFGVDDDPAASCTRP